jgi:hypothetical protein
MFTLSLSLFYLIPYPIKKEKQDSLPLIASQPSPFQVLSPSIHGLSPWYIRYSPVYFSEKKIEKCQLRSG